jgi:hypothetical protein
MSPYIRKCLLKRPAANLETLFHPSAAAWLLAASRALGGCSATTG